MAGRKRTAASRRNDAPAEPTGGQIYMDMLGEAGVNARRDPSPERPLKRRRPGARRAEKRPEEPSQAEGSSSKPEQIEKPAPSVGDDEDDEDVEFEDVALPEPTMQTMELESDDDEDDEDLQFEDVDFTAPLKGPESAPQEPQALELNLTVQKTAAEQSRKAAERRKPISREDKKRRLEIHKAHILCLLSHIARRNHWCNDAKVHQYLEPHLTDKMVSYLTPGTNLPQFGRTESIKNGLKQAQTMWNTKFEVTERGLRRALWAEEPEHLKDVSFLVIKDDRANKELV